MCTVKNPVYGGSDPDKTPPKVTLQDYEIPQPQSEEGVYDLLTYSHCHYIMYDFIIPSRYIHFAVVANVMLVLTRCV